MSTNAIENVQAAEAAAPVNTSGPLPLAVNTLAYIPSEHRWRYDRTMEGGFRLGVLNLGDNTHLTTYAQEIKNGAIVVLPEGEDRRWLAEQERIRREQRAAVQAELKRLEDERHAKRVAAMEKQIADERAASERRLEQLRRANRPF